MCLKMAMPSRLHRMIQLTNIRIYPYIRRNLLSLLYQPGNIGSIPNRMPLACTKFHRQAFSCLVYLSLEMVWFAALTKSKTIFLPQLICLQHRVLLPVLLHLSWLGSIDPESRRSETEWWTSLLQLPLTASWLSGAHISALLPLTLNGLARDWCSFLPYRALLAQWTGLFEEMRWLKTAIESVNQSET